VSGQRASQGQKEVPSDILAAVTVAAGLSLRLWLAHATYFNTDEAWHFAVANQNSLVAAYKASLTLAHPPLLVLVVYFWKHFGTSDVMLRLPGVLAGSIFCWIFYKWLERLFGDTVALVGLILAALLPPMIALSAELRQYDFLLMFAMLAAYFLERAFDENSAAMMLLSSVSLYLAMLSHYSAFLFAASLGLYAILRIAAHRPRTPVIAVWGVGQFIGVMLSAFLYKTHIANLRSVYPGDPLRRFGDFYIADWYFHAGRESLAHFLYRGTFGVFRFTFGHTGAGQIAAVLFVAGVCLLIFRSPKDFPAGRSAAALLVVPFVLNWAAVAAGFYPYGRTRQCIYLALFGLAGASVAIARLAKNHTAGAAASAVVIVAICQIFGTVQGRDMLSVSEQRRMHFDQAVEFVRNNISPPDVILTDRATSFQLVHYLCPQTELSLDVLTEGFGTFHCRGLQIRSAAPGDGALTAESLSAQWHELQQSPSVPPANQIWVVQGGWASGLGEALRDEFPTFATVEPRSFGQYLEIFRLPSPAAEPDQR
jgi:hypothetical protein